MKTNEPSWREAGKIAYRSFPALEVERVSISQCAERILAQDVRALCDLPTYTTSAMDGYVVCGTGPWHIEGDIKAGKIFERKLNDGQAVRIATGAVIPEGSYGVLRWEDARIVGSLLSGEVEHNQDIRPAGYECREGDLLVAKGTRLSPSQIGLLAAAGFDEISISKRPRISLITFGDELQFSGVPSEGLVRDSLGPQIPAWLQRLSAEIISSSHVDDNLDLVVNAMSEEIEKCDFLITTGGTADGPRDHMRAALAAIGAEFCVDRVRVRPGHPMILASTRNKKNRLIPILGLPGNPQSAIVGLMTLGIPVLNALTGSAPATTERAVSATDLQAPANFTRLVLGNLVEGKFIEGDHLGSAMLRGLANSGGFAVVQDGLTPAGKGIEWLALP
jgi:molybdopterin molybdotransferase